MKANLARQRQSFLYLINLDWWKTRHLVLLFLCHHGSSQCCRMVFENKAFRSFCPPSPYRGGNEGAQHKWGSCVRTEGRWDQGATPPTSEYHPSHRTIPARGLVARPHRRPSWISGIHFWCWTFAVLIFRHAYITTSKLFSRFSLAQGWSSPSFPYVICCFASSLN